jgi:hypothetical protein
MRLIRLFTVPAAAGAIILLGMSSASAGEVTGNGNPTPPGTFGHAASICSFSGLDDGSEGGAGGPGAAPQNWGQIPKAVRDMIAAEGEHPGDACNGSTGIVAMSGVRG